MTEIVKADPKARRQAVAVLVIVLVCGAALIAGYEANKASLAEWLTPRLSEFTAHPEVLVLVLLPFLPLVFFAVFLVRYSVKVMKAKRIPLPGEPVIRDTYVIEGEKAAARARLLLMLAVILGLAGLALPLFICYILLTVAAI